MKMSSRLFRRRVSGLFVLTIFILSVFSFLAYVDTALAAPSNIGLRWAKYLGPNALMTSAPVAADLNGDGKMEIIVTGGPATGNSGSVTCLNPIDGSILWQDTSANISNIGIDQHCPPETADLLGNGKQEVIVPTWNGPLVLFGNGSVYWRRTDVSCGNVYLATCDINGDGHPEIFCSRGLGPANGYDYTTVLSYNGSVLYQGWSWHDCWGGLTVADPTGEGNFMIFQGDRSYTYADLFDTPPDAYTGGGMGVHAFDAFTGQMIWSDPTILCSSQIPILADVDHTGIPDVIVAMQNLAPPVRNSSNSQGGIAVLNSLDGSVDTTGGIYREGWTNMTCHSQPTVYDFSGSGELDLEDCYDSQVKFWNLVTWQPDGYLPLNNQLNITCHEPPKAGYVTADGKLDIIAMNENDTYMYVFQYDATQPGNYREVYKSTITMPGANDFTLVEDLDGDGYNELAVTSRAGWVYLFNTPGVALFPQPQSGAQFYGNTRAGVAVYVPPFTPVVPVIRAEQPEDGAVNQTFSPHLSITATSFQNRLMNITFGTNATGTWSQVGSTLKNEADGVYSVSTSGMSTPGTTYYWNVSCYDGVTTTTHMYSFTTYSNSPSQGTPSLSVDGSGDVTCSNQTTSDPNNYPVTNIYNWQVNGTSIDTLNLPFDTETTSNLLNYDNLTSDGFENGFVGWSGNGVTSWNLDTSQKHSGAYSAHAGTGSQYLTTNDTDTSSCFSVTVSFWYREQGFGASNMVSLQFWNGTAYNTIFSFTSSNPSNSWQWYSVQTFSPQYVIKNFRVRFSAAGIGAGNFWLDDFAISCPARTKDYSGYNNNGTLNDVTWTPNGAVGGAYVFDGTDSYIRVNDNPSLGGDGTRSQITIEFWVTPSSNQNGVRILAKRDPTISDVNSSYMIGFETSGAPNTLFWGINNGTGWQETSNGASVLTIGNWYDVVCTYSSGPGLTIYINGTEVANVPVTGNIAQSQGLYLSGAPLFIGFDGGNPTQSTWFNGTLDELHIYSRALSAAEIHQRYVETKNGLSSNSTIDSQEIGSGDTWICQVTPNDGFGDGQTVSSTPYHPGPTVTYNLTIQSAGNGTTNPAPAVYSYIAGTQVSVSAIPASGMVLSQWLLNGTSVGAANPYNFSMTQNYNLTAVFSAAPAVLFSDGFESGGFGAWSGLSLSSGTTGVVTGAAAYQGSYGASFGSSGVSGYLNAYCYESIASASDIFARSYFYITQSGITSSGARFYFMVFTAGGNPVAYAGWRMVGSVVEWDLLIRAGTGWIDAYNSSSILTGQWVSVELNWYENSTSGYAGLYVNGQLTCSIQGQNTASFGGVDTVRVGLPELYNCGPTTVYCDSVVISTTYIGPLTTSSTVNLQSVETGGPSSNYGQITFNGTAQNLPFSGTYTTGTYSAQYSPNVGYVFYNWTTTGQIAVSNAYANPTTVTVLGNGTLTAVYKINSTVLFSDGFESGGFGAWSGLSLSSGTTGVVTGAAARQGSYGASFGSSGVSGYLNAYCYESIASASDIFARSYFYITQSGITSSSSSGTRFYFMVFTAGGNPVAYAGWRMVGSVVEWDLLIRAGTGWIDAYNSSSISTGQWISAELNWYENSTSGYANLYINGQLTCSIQGQNTASFGGVDTVRVGLPELYNCGPTTVYCDSVVISTTYNGP